MLRISAPFRLRPGNRDQFETVGKHGKAIGVAVAGGDGHGDGGLLRGVQPVQMAVQRIDELQFQVVYKLWSDHDQAFAQTCGVSELRKHLRQPLGDVFRQMDNFPVFRLQHYRRREAPPAVVVNVNKIQLKYRAREIPDARFINASQE